MTVYVDDMKAPFGHMKMCHMIGETEAELHAMADTIGVARKWYQGNHYDIALSKRRLAVAAGAVEITMREAAKMRSVWLETGRMPKPEEVPALYANDVARMRSRLAELGVELPTRTQQPRRES